jgi:hypothetical protein
LAAENIPKEAKTFNHAANVKKLSISTPPQLDFSPTTLIRIELSESLCALKERVCVLKVYKILRLMEGECFMELCAFYKNRHTHTALQLNYLQWRALTVICAYQPLTSHNENFLSTLINAI